MKSKIAQNPSYRFFINFRSKHCSPQQINCEKFIIGCMVGFLTILDQRQVFTTLDKNWIVHALYLSACSCDAMYCVRESQSRVLLLDVYQTFLPNFFGARLEYMFEQSLKLWLHIPNSFSTFQVLKWFLLLLEVTCIIFAHATNTDMWQAIIASATKSRKNCSKPP